MQNDHPPIFRVFVSSTFSDFHQERDHLEQQVFPRVRQFCEARGARFQHVDLRWGISESAAREMKATELCELELQRCQQLSPRPNFVILAGDRYGWCPPPRKISETDWLPLLKVLSDQNAQYLSAAYQRDEFASPPDYLLRPDRDLIPTVNAILREASQQAFPTDETRRLRYQASITHQEIWAGALSSLTPIDHVFLFHRQFHALPATADNPQRQIYGDYLADGSLDQTKYSNQRELCRSLRTMLPETSQYSVTAAIEDWPRQTDMAEFGRRLEQHLCRVIDEELAARRTSHPIEDASMPNGAVDDLIDSAIPRDELVDEILLTTQQSSGQPVFVTGGSGTGKSTLLAMLWRRLQVAGEEVLWFSPSLTGSESHLIAFLNQINASLAARLNVLSPPSETSASAALEFARLLEISTPRTIYLILDGLDQLEPSERAHELWWLPTATLPHVSLVASIAVEAGETTTIGRALASRFESSRRVEVGELGLSRALLAVDHHLARRGRLVSGKHRDQIRDALTQNSTALYARLISQVAATWQSFAAAPSLPADSVALFQEICRAWSADKEHGPRLVQTVVGAIAISRTGLTEDEILDLVNRSEGVQDEVRVRFSKAPKRPSLPFAVWSRLSHDLQPFLAEQASERRLVFFHGKLRRAAIDWAVPDSTTRIALHAALASYFEERGLKSARTAARTDLLSRRFLSEAVYHATQSANAEVIGRLTTVVAIRALDKFLGVGRTQIALHEFCRSLSDSDAVDLQCLLQCARSFVARQQESAGRHRNLATTSELLYAGDFAAAEMLIAAQVGTRQRLSYAGAAEILDSLQQPDLAKRFRQKAGDTNSFCNDLPPLERQILKSLSQPDRPIAIETPPEAVAPATLPKGEKRHRIAKAIWISLAFFVMYLSGVAYTLGTLSLIFLPVAWASGDGQLWNRVGGFFWSFLLLLAVTRLVSARIFRRSALLASQDMARSILANAPSSTRNATMLCCILDWLEFARPLMTDLPTGVLIRYAVHEAPPATAARLLIQCATVLHWSDQQIGQQLRMASAGRQHQLVAALRQYALTSTIHFPLYSALARSLPGVEAASLLATVADRLHETALQRERDQQRWFSRWRKPKPISTAISSSAVLQELSRQTRGEILLLPDRKVSRSAQLLWTPLIYWPRTFAYTFAKTHPLEKLFLAVAFLGCVQTLLTVTSFGRDFNNTLMFIVFSLLLLWGLSYILGLVDWLGLLLNDREWGRSTHVNHFLRHKEPPWHWSAWFPIVGGYSYLMLLFQRSTNLANGRSGYGGDFDADLERYSQDWAPIVQRYLQQRHQRSHSIPPPTYAILGPAGLADLLLLRLILRRGWTTAMNGPVFPAETWKRVTELLTRPDWLGPSPSLLTETLRMPVAAQVVIDRLHKQVDSGSRSERRITLEELDLRLDDQWSNASDVAPVIQQRLLVAAIALAVAVLAIHPYAMPVCRAIVGGRPFPESGFIYWYCANVGIAAWYIPAGRSRLVRVASCAAGYAGFFVLSQFMIGSRAIPFPLSTSIERAGTISAFNAAALPLLFFAPWIIATYRGSLLLFPSQSTRFAARCMAILMVPLLSVALLAYLQVSATVWIGVEKLLQIGPPIDG